MFTTVIVIASLTVVAGAEENSSGYVFKEETLIYNCTINLPIIPDINFDMPLTIRADVPESVLPNQQFDLLNASATAEVPGNVINTLDAVLGWDVMTGTVSKFEVKSENTNSTVDIGPLGIPATDVPKDGSDLVFTVPVNGIDVGSFTAGTSGVVTIKAGGVNASFKKLNAGWLDPTLNANCTPPSNNILVEIPITP